MIRTFISYHHANDQAYKEAFCSWASSYGLISDYSVNTGEINPDLPNQTIRKTIRDNYLRDSEVTILLCGRETKFRKHVDWELKSSMIDGTINRRSGILVINLPTIVGDSEYAAFGQAEKDIVYADYDGGWIDVETKSHYSDRHPSLPGRIIENLVNPAAEISVVNWDRIYGYPQRLKFLLNKTANSAATNNYDTARVMRMKNFNPKVDTFDFRV